MASEKPAETPPQLTAPGDASPPSTYLVAGQGCTAFAVGEAAQQTDFFLAGCEPDFESNFPLLSGLLFDAQGQLLCRLVRNVLAYNPGGCTRVFSEGMGYEVLDKGGKLVLEVETTLKALPGETEEKFVTTLAGKFYNQAGQVAFEAKDGHEGEQLAEGVKRCYGSQGKLTLAEGYSEAEVQVIAAMLGTRGRIAEVMGGKHEDEEFLLDGKALVDAHLLKCKVHVQSGIFARFGECKVENCEIIFHDQAANIHNMTMGLAQQQQKEQEGAGTQGQQ